MDTVTSVSDEDLKKFANVPNLEEVKDAEVEEEIVSPSTEELAEQIHTAKK